MLAVSSCSENIQSGGIELIMNMFVDFPRDGTILFSRNFMLTGWAVSESPIISVEVYCKNKLIGVCKYGSERSDVFDVYPSVLGSKYSGFWGDVTLPKEVKQGNPIIVRCRGQNGQFIEMTRKVYLSDLKELYTAAPYRNYLPKIEYMENKITEGRNIKHGYQRAYGLSYGDLKECIKEDLDFMHIYNLIGARSIVSPEKIMNLFLIIKFYMKDSIMGKCSIIEFGSYRGGSAIFMAALCKRLKLPITVYGLDTFEGMPETNNKIDVHTKSDFNDVDLDEINAYKDSIGLDNLIFIKGLFSDTAPELLNKVSPVALTHIDCDIFSAVSYAYDIVKPYMVEGGYYVFDDATMSSCLGATNAVEKLVIRRDGLNCEQIYPHFVFRAY